MFGKGTTRSRAWKKKAQRRDMQMEDRGGEMEPDELDLMPLFGPGGPEGGRGGPRHGGFDMGNPSVFVGPPGPGEMDRGPGFDGSGPFMDGPPNQGFIPPNGPMGGFAGGEMMSGGPPRGPESMGLNPNAFQGPGPNDFGRGPDTFEPNGFGLGSEFGGRGGHGFGPGRGGFGGDQPPMGMGRNVLFQQGVQEANYFPGNPDNAGIGPQTGAFQDMIDRHGPMFDGPRGSHGRLNDDPSEPMPLFGNQSAPNDQDGPGLLNLFQPPVSAASRIGNIPGSFGFGSMNFESPGFPGSMPQTFSAPSVRATGPFGSFSGRSFEEPRSDDFAGPQGQSGPNGSWQRMQPDLGSREDSEPSLTNFRPPPNRMTEEQRQDPQFLANLARPDARFPSDRMTADEPSPLFVRGNKPNFPPVSMGAEGSKPVDMVLEPPPAESDPEPMPLFGSVPPALGPKLSGPFARGIGDMFGADGGGRIRIHGAAPPPKQESFNGTVMNSAGTGILNPVAFSSTGKSGPQNVSKSDLGGPPKPSPFSAPGPVPKIFPELKQENKNGRKTRFDEPKNPVVQVAAPSATTTSVGQSPFLAKPWSEKKDDKGSKELGNRVKNIMDRIDNLKKSNLEKAEKETSDKTSKVVVPPSGLNKSNLSSDKSRSPIGDNASRNRQPSNDASPGRFGKYNRNSPMRLPEPSPLFGERKTGETEAPVNRSSRWEKPQAAQKSQDSSRDLGVVDNRDKRKFDSRDSLFEKSNDRGKVFQPPESKMAKQDPKSDKVPIGLMLQNRGGQGQPPKGPSGPFPKGVVPPQSKPSNFDFKAPGFGNAGTNRTDGFGSLSQVQQPRQQSGSQNDPWSQFQRFPMPNQESPRFQGNQGAFADMGAYNDPTGKPPYSDSRNVVSGPVVDSRPAGFQPPEGKIGARYAQDPWPPSPQQFGQSTGDSNRASGSPAVENFGQFAPNQTAANSRWSNPGPRSYAGGPNSNTGLGGQMSAEPFQKQTQSLSQNMRPSQGTTDGRPEMPSRQDNSQSDMVSELVSLLARPENSNLASKLVASLLVPEAAGQEQEKSMNNSSAAMPSSQSSQGARASFEQDWNQATGVQFKSQGFGATENYGNLSTNQMGQQQPGSGGTWDNTSNSSDPQFGKQYWADILTRVGKGVSQRQGPQNPAGPFPQQQQGRGPQNPTGAYPQQQAQSYNAPFSTESQFYSQTSNMTQAQPTYNGPQIFQNQNQPQNQPQFAPTGNHNPGVGSGTSPAYQNFNFGSPGYNTQANYGYGDTYPSYGQGNPAQNPSSMFSGRSSDFETRALASVAKLLSEHQGSRA